MDRKTIRDLSRKGLSDRQIAARLGLSRLYVKSELETIRRERGQKICRWLSLIFSLAVALGIGILALKTAITEPSSEKWGKNLIKIADELAANAADDVWLIKEEVLSSEMIFQQRIRLGKKTIEKIESSLTQNSDIPEVKRIEQRFKGHFFVSLLSTGQRNSNVISSSEEEILSILNDPLRLEIVLFDKEAAESSWFRRGLFAYDPEWRAIFIPAIKPSEWFDAVLIHELWHAYLNSHSPFLSDSWIAEEVSAHQLEEKILNKKTKGRYRENLRKIIQKRKTSSLPRFLNELTLQDIQLLDSLFTQGSKLEMSQRVGQYILNLAYAWLQSKYSGDILKQKKIETYRLIFETIGN